MAKTKFEKKVQKSFESFLNDPKNQENIRAMYFHYRGKIVMVYDYHERKNILMTRQKFDSLELGNMIAGVVHKQDHPKRYGLIANERIFANHVRRTMPTAEYQKNYERFFPYSNDRSGF